MVFSCRQLGLLLLILVLLLLKRTRILIFIKVYLVLVLQVLNNIKAFLPLHHLIGLLLLLLLHLLGQGILLVVMVLILLLSFVPSTMDTLVVMALLHLCLGMGILPLCRICRLTPQTV